MDNYDHYNNDNPNQDNQNNAPTNGNNDNTNNNNNNGYPNQNDYNNPNNYNPNPNGCNQGAPDPNYRPYPQQPPYKQNNNMALASMFVGIFALLSCCFPPLQFVLGVVGILLVIFSKKGKPWSGFAIAGLVLSILSLLISIFMVVYLVFAYQVMKDPQFAPMFNEIYEMYETMPVQ